MSLCFSRTLVNCANKTNLNPEFFRSLTFTISALDLFNKRIASDFTRYLEIKFQVIALFSYFGHLHGCNHNNGDLCEGQQATVGTEFNMSTLRLLIEIYNN